jgi:hypothetical protein
MKQMKEDNDQWRKWRQKKDKEVLQLQQKVSDHHIKLKFILLQNMKSEIIIPQTTKL